MTAPLQPAKLTDADIEATAHRKAWRYEKSSDPAHSDTYTFNQSTLVNFSRTIIAMNVAQAAPVAAEALTVEEFIAIADATKSADPGRDGYILPVTYGRAVEAAVIRAMKVAQAAPVAAIRDQALEDAAQECESWGDYPFFVAASAIRAMKGAT
jgi:hypothetical protein